MKFIHLYDDVESVWASCTYDVFFVWFVIAIGIFGRYEYDLKNYIWRSDVQNNSYFKTCIPSFACYAANSE